MDEIEKTSSNAAGGFYEHLVSGDVKSEILNIAQYSSLAIIPVVALNKAMQHLFPDIDEKKNNLELTMEVLAQVVFLFSALYFIDKAIRYVKPYSGVDYEEVSHLPSLGPFIVVLLSMQSKIGQKINIVAERVMVQLNISKKPAQHKEIAVRPSAPPIENDMRELIEQAPQTSQNSPIHSNGRVAVPAQQGPPPTSQGPSPPPPQNIQEQKPDFNNMFEAANMGSDSFSSNFSAF